MVFHRKDYNAGLNLSRKEFIVAGIITRFKISTGVAVQGRYHFEELGVSLPSLEGSNWSQTVIASSESKRLTADFLREHPSAPIVLRTAPLPQLARVPPESGSRLPDPRLKKAADWHKRDRALLSPA